MNKKISDKVAWQAMQNLVDKFKFDQEQGQKLLGDILYSTYHQGLSKHNIHLNRDQKDRISYLLSIYKSLCILFTDSHQAMTWIDRNNSLPPFNGLTPRTYMLEGSLIRLAEVRRFLELQLFS